MDDKAQFEREMNSALDQELAAEELAALEAQLADAPDIAATWERLKQVDDVVRQTPLVAPLPGFAQRVMAAIAAMPLPEYMRRHTGLGLALGLLVAAFFSLPLLAALLLVLAGALTDPAAISALLQAAASAVNYVIGLAGDMGDELRGLLRDTPLVIALLTAVIPVTLLWLWSLWYLLRGRHVATNQPTS